MALYIRLTSAIIAMRWFRKRIKTPMSGGCTAGPTMSVELRETPVDVVAEASNTARIFVVYSTPYRQHAWACRRLGLGVSLSLPVRLLQRAVGQNTLARPFALQGRHL